ncbi:acetyl-CoA carboxylase, carboxyltransferase subunit beta [Peptococcaceae bacterium]|nr:acetyl-CoA carboxylase, carboxyltransferase subunit beta [Peptococcaceae bacterium]
MSIFKKKKYITIKADSDKKADIPEGLWVKCTRCGAIVYTKELKKNYKICLKCGFHFRMGARERIDMICDKDTFVEFNSNIVSVDPLGFPGYKEKLKLCKEKSGLNEAVITGKGSIDGHEVVLAVMDPNFIMGSMGSVVGEKITLAIETALADKKPLVIFTASGGARMQEGMLSLMQMAKTASALSRLHDVGILYIAVLTDPTTGGVTASFASLGDIIIAEPEALIGFAGPRVIEQTIKQKLPQGFQRAEFMLQHGFIDMIVERKELKNKLANILSLHC